MTAARDLVYGDLFDLVDLPADVWAQVDDSTSRHAKTSLARVQSESYYEGGWLWLDTSFGFFRLNPDHQMPVVRNEPHPFGSRSK